MSKIKKDELATVIAHNLAASLSVTRKGDLDKNKPDTVATPYTKDVTPAELIEMGRDLYRRSAFIAEGFCKEQENAHSTVA